MLDIFLPVLKTEEDKGVFINIYEEYKQLLYGLSLIYLKDKSLAEDCVNTVFMDIADYFDTFKKIPAENREAYLARCCKNAAYRINKDFHNDISYDDYSESGIDEASSGFYYIDYDKFRVIEAINKLDSKYREPFIMKHITGLSPAEISKMMGISPNLVSQRVIRAEKMLRKMLSEE